MNDRYFFIIDKSFKGKLVSQRKRFMELLLKTMGDTEEESSKELKKEFGVKLVTVGNPANTISIINDGEVVYKL